MWQLAGFASSETTSLSESHRHIHQIPIWLCVCDLQRWWIWVLESIRTFCRSIDLNWSATTLKPLMDEVNKNVHPVTIQYSTGKFYWLKCGCNFDLHHCPWTLLQTKCTHLWQQPNPDENGHPAGPYKDLLRNGLMVSVHMGAFGSEGTQFLPSFANWPTIFTI